MVRIAFSNSFIFQEEECETHYQLRETDLYRGLGVTFVNGTPWSTCLHKEEIRQGPKFIRKKENGHSSSASADRQWDKDGDCQQTKQLTPANLTLLLGHCIVAPLSRVFILDRWEGRGSK